MIIVRVVIMSMWLKINTVRGKKYLVITERYWDKKTKTSRMKTYKSLGSLDKLSEIYDDPISHFKAEVNRLNEEIKQNKRLLELKIDTSFVFDQMITNCKNIGYIALSKIYHELLINRFFNNYSRAFKSQFNTNSIVKLLVFQRVLSPQSKKATWETKDIFFEKSNFSLEDIYRCLTKINILKDDLIDHLLKQIAQSYSINREVIYYDVTNYYFEIDKEDEFRKKGVSKEHRPNPIIQMGLFIDSNQIPISYKLFEGNTHDTKTLIPTFNQVKDRLNIKKTIVVADKGLNSAENKIQLVKTNNGYVFSETLIGGSKDLKDFVLDQKGYKGYKDSFKVKSRIVKKTLYIKDDKTNKRKKHVISEKQIAIYSFKYAAKTKYKRDKLIAKAQDLINNPSKYNKMNSYGARKFIKHLVFDEKTGEIITQSSKLMLDEAKINYYQDFDGYYVIVTSELDKSDTEILEIYHSLFQIEDAFRVTKSDLQSRPVYLSRKDRIEAHFLICFISLILIKLLSIRLNSKYRIAQIRKSLKNSTVSYLEKNLYITNYVDEVILDIDKYLGIKLNKKYLTEQEIRILAGSVKTK